MCTLSPLNDGNMVTYKADKQSIEAINEIIIMHLVVWGLTSIA